jgi:acetyl/propionyl-CoA carboxylase alpha subunit
VSHLVVPAGVRWDSAVEPGGEITPHYDSMLAKLVVHGVDRDAARRRLARALDRLIIGGLVTNSGLHRWLVEQPPVVAGRVTTRFLDETELPVAPPPATSVAARAWVEARRATPSSSVWSAAADFRSTPHRPTRVVALRSLDGTLHEVPVGDLVDPGGDERAPTVSVDVASRSVAVNVTGTTQTFAVVSRTERWAPSIATGHGHATAVAAPFPAVVTSVEVTTGQHVGTGEPVVVIEAMKMLHTLTAAGPGIVAEIRVSTGEQVASHQILVTFDPLTDQEDAAP